MTKPVTKPPVTTSALLMWAALLLAARANAQGGVVCAGVDDTAILQAALSVAPRASTVHLSGPLCVTTATLTSSVDQSLNIVGDGPGTGVGGGTQVRGNIAGPIFNFAPGSGTGRGGSFRDISVRNTNPVGLGIVYGDFVTAKIENVYIDAYRGIFATHNVFGLLIETARVTWHGAVAGDGSIGIATAGHTTILNADVVGFDNGIRAWGTTVNIIGCRIEVNWVGLSLGMRDDNVGWILSRSTISGNSFEANDEGVHVYNLVASSVRDLAIQGSTYGPGGNPSKYGIRITTGSFTAVEFSTASVNGLFTVAAISGLSGSAKQVSFNTINAGNFYPSGAVWTFNNPQLFTFTNTNYTP